MTPEELKAAREWISECEWGDLEPEDVGALDPVIVVRGVERWYEGGWSQFVSDLA